MKSAISWFDIPSNDFDRAIKFYSTILGEEVKVQVFQGMTLGFFPMGEGGEVGGDLVPPGDENKPSDIGTRVYLNCEGKIDDVLNRVKDAGGRIIGPKFEIPDVGWIAFIEDTEGNTVGLHSSI